jgi:hypothetical protein
MEKPDTKAAQALRDFIPLLDEMEARIREALGVLKKLEARLTRKPGRAIN